MSGPRRQPPVYLCVCACLSLAVPVVSARFVSSIPLAVRRDLRTLQQQWRIIGYARWAVAYPVESRPPIHIGPFAAQ
jgi:hypothetical protein